VFVQTVAAGCEQRDGFGFAAGREDGKWLGFAFGRRAFVTLNDEEVLISHPTALAYQDKLDEEQRAKRPPSGVTPVPGGATQPIKLLDDSEPTPPVENKLPTRFFGVVSVDADTATMNFSTIVNEVIQHFSTQMGVDVKVTVEIEARSREGFSTGVQRTVKENCGVLRFRTSDFEKD
jgi:hypothetical protein